MLMAFTLWLRNIVLILRACSASYTLPGSSCGLKKTYLDPYLTRLCNLTPLQTPVLPDSACPPQSKIECAPLNSPLTLTEISSGLTRLHNGRSFATSGLLAELYRYAQATPTPEAPSLPHLLAPVLLNILNSAFMLGHVPTPCHFGPFHAHFQER
jgi:hypothetical protein